MACRKSLVAACELLVVACGIGVLATGPPGKFPYLLFFFNYFLNLFMAVLGLCC